MRIDKPGLFSYTNITVLSLAAIVTLYPFIYVVAISMSSFGAYSRNPIMLIPREITFSAYEKIFANPAIFRSYGVTIFVTAVGTILNMVATSLMAYTLSKREIPGTSFVLSIVVFFMIFNPALIPKYLLAKQLGLLDSYWALILPTLISPFNLILLKNFFSSIPASLEESALMDGADYTLIFRKVIVPLSGHAISTISLFYAVAHWNNYFSAVVYIKSMAKWPIQLLLREVVMQNNMESVLGGNGASDLDMVDVVPFTIQMATVVVATVPILCVYPFIQKYFSQGVMLGSIKE